MNAQTVTFVSDRQAEIISTVEEMAERDPSWHGLAEVERERRQALQEIARDEQRLATAINLGTESSFDAAFEERDLRRKVLEVAVGEGRTAEGLRSIPAADDDPTPAVLAEQAERNRELLLHVADTEGEAERVLEDDQGTP